MKKIKKNVGEGIKKIRKELELTQSEFGKKISIGKQSIANIEGGDNNPSEQTLQLIELVYSVRSEFLRLGEPPIFESLKETEMQLEQIAGTKSKLLAPLVNDILQMPERERLAVEKFIKNEYRKLKRFLGEDC